ncbi:MAG: sigma-70 family RNA polymerase sigma factor [Cyanobacteria bacterium P01_A01_bin.135]
MPSAEINSESSDADLLQQLWAGDRAALGVLYDRYASLVYTLGLKLLANVQEAEDLTQEIFLLLLRQGCYSPKRGTLAAYLTTLTRSRAIDRLRSQTVRRKYHLKWQTLKLPQPDLAGLERATQQENQALVRDSLATLAPRQRQVIEQSYYGGRTYADIAKELDIPLNTVKSLARRGLMKLRDTLAHRNEDKP